MAIVNAVERIPAERAAEVEELLCDHARRLTPQQVAYAGKQILAHLDPDGVYRDEREGKAQRSLRMYKDQNGWVWFKGNLFPAQGAMFEAALHSVSNPRSVGGEKDPRTAEQRMADGLCELVRIAMSTAKLPSNGGIRPQVIVTLPSR